MELLSIAELGPVQKLLQEGLPQTLHLLSCLEEPRSEWEFWVDKRDDPQALLLRRGEWLSAYAPDGPFLKRHLGEFIPFAVAEGEEKGLLKFGALLPHLARAARGLWGSVRQSPCYLYALRASDFRPYPQAGLEPLRLEDAPLVARHWLHGDDVELCRQRIASGRSFAVRRAGKPISWILTYDDGSMGMLHTLEEWRRKGRGKGVTSALAESILDNGKTPFCFILQDNEPSVRLFESLGFHRVTECFWLIANPGV